MFAINHAATALLVKKKYPAAPTIWLLAGHPTIIVTVIAVQIVVMLPLVGALSSRGASRERQAVVEGRAFVP